MRLVSRRFRSFPLPHRSSRAPLIAARVVLLCAPFATSLSAQDAGGNDAPASRAAKAEAPKSGPPSGAFAPSDAEVDAAIAAGVAFLVARQFHYDGESDSMRPPGRRATKEEIAEFEIEKARRAAEAARRAGGKPSEWPYEGVHRQRDGRIPAGYRVGGASIVCLALSATPGFKDDAPRREAYLRGLKACLDLLEKDPLLKSGFAETYDTRGWGHIYGLFLALDALKRGAAGSEEARARAWCKKLVKTLEDTEIPETGGWNYSRPNGADRPNPASPFMTAPALQALFEAGAAGFKTRRDVVERALKTLEDARTGAGSFQYSTNPARKKAVGGDAPPGSCARSAACETTLLLAGRGSVDRVRGAVAAFFEHWDELEKRRAKTGTHLPPYQIAPYYFHYGHAFVAQAIEALPESERPEWRGKLREVYWRTREPDGSWNDRVFERSAAYGTAMALLGLTADRREPPAPWRGS
jgi:hypothetical protein